MRSMRRIILTKRRNSIDRLPFVPKKEKKERERARGRREKTKGGEKSGALLPG